MQDGKTGIGMVFIGGAGLQPSVWDRVRADIGAPSIAVAFPNRGNGPANADLTLDDYVAEAKRQVDAAPFRKCVLVCHSIGGVVGLRLAGTLGAGLKGFVAVSASIPASGQSYLSSLPFPQGAVAGLVMRMMGTRPPDGVIKSALCSGLGAEDVKDVVDRFTPEAKGLYFSKVEHGGISAPAMYVKTSRDRAFAPAVQERMARNLGAGRVETIESGHLPMLSAPAELAGMLDQFMRMA